MWFQERVSRKASGLLPYFSRRLKALLEASLCPDATMPEDEPAAADALRYRRSANSNSGPEVEDTLAHLGGSRAVLRQICGQCCGCFMVVFSLWTFLWYALEVRFDKLTLVDIAKIFGGVVVWVCWVCIMLHNVINPGCIGFVRLRGPETNVGLFSLYVTVCALVLGAITGSWHVAFAGALHGRCGRCGRWPLWQAH